MWPWSISSAPCSPRVISHLHSRAGSLGWHSPHAALQTVICSHAGQRDLQVLRPVGQGMQCKAQEKATTAACLNPIPASNAHRAQPSTLQASALCVQATPLTSLHKWFAEPAGIPSWPLSMLHRGLIAAERLWHASSSSQVTLLKHARSALGGLEGEIGHCAGGPHICLHIRQKYAGLRPQALLRYSHCSASMCMACVLPGPPLTVWSDG